MTVVAVKVFPKKIEIAADNQTTWGYNKMPKQDYSDKQINASGKIFQVNGMTMGCAGSVATVGLLQLFCKGHQPKEPERDDILTWFVEFKRWCTSTASISDAEICINIIMVFKNRVFVIYDWLDIHEVKSFHAVGSGMFLALGAMEVGADVDVAVGAAIKYDTFCGGKVTKLVLKK